MKVLIVNHLLDAHSGGGTAERTFQLARSFVQAGIDTTVLTLDIGIDAARRDSIAGANLALFPCINKRFFIPWISIAEVDQLVSRADVVHLSGHWTILNALIFRSCKRLRKPFVFCPAGALHSFGRSRVLKRIYDVIVGKDIVATAAACIAITEQERDDFLCHGVGRDRITIIPNGVDAAQYHSPDSQQIVEGFRQQVGIGTAPFILFLGRQNEIKGPDMLLHAFSMVAQRFPDIHLVFAGPDGGLQTSLKSFAKKKGLEARVHFPGYVDGITKIGALRAARLLVIPSRREAMSIVILEAGVCGTPVLFTNMCGLEGIASAGAGTMVAASVDELARGLTLTIDDPAALDDTAKKLELLVQRNFSWGLQAERYRHIFESLLQGAT